MKAYTDIEQSKQLAKILPIESADMYYWCGDRISIGGYKAMDKDLDIPAWSLAALLENIPVSCDDGQHCFALINCNPKGDTEWLSCYEDCNGNLLNECYSDNPIDVCYEMIVKLKEKGLM